MDKDVKNKVVLVLGGLGGVGLAIADLLEKEGAVVCRHDRSGEYSADVSDSGQTGVLIQKILEKYGKVDVIVNSLTAPLRVGGIEVKTWDDIQLHLNVQLKASFDSAKLLVPSMKEHNSGHFINILSSVVVATPRMVYPDYVTAKYAVMGFSKALADELKQTGIMVSCVSPDFMKTKLTEHFPEKLGEIVSAQTQSGRLTTPEDVAGVVLDLIRNPGDTGRNIVISGGQVV